MEYAPAIIGLFLAATTCIEAITCPHGKEPLCTTWDEDTSQHMMCTNHCTRSAGYTHKIPLPMCVVVPIQTCDYCHCKDDKFLDIESQVCRSRAACLARPAYEPQITVRRRPLTSDAYDGLDWGHRR